MMQEVNVDGDSAGASIADELRDAAQTPVTQAHDHTAQGIPVNPPPPVANPASPPGATMQPPCTPQPPPSAPSQSTMAGPPTTGFVPKPGVTTPAHYPLPNQRSTPTPPPTGAPPATFTPPPAQVYTPGGAISQPSPYSQSVAPSMQSMSLEHSATPPVSTYQQTPYNPIQLPIAGMSGPHSPAAAAGTSATSVDIGGDSLGPVYPTHHEHNQGLRGWFSGGGGFMNKVMEKTIALSENIVTTLDPGMKEVLFSGGDMEVVVASEKEVKVGAVRQAFQEIFGRASVYGAASEPGIAPQPVGYTAGLKGCEGRLAHLRRNSRVNEQHTLVAVENFIVEIFPDKWFDVGCLLLKDPVHHIELNTFTQATPIDSSYVTQAQDETPADYPLRWSGLAITVGNVISRHTNAPHDNWHANFCGISRREMIYSAAKALANMYKQRLPPQAYGQ